MDDGSSSTLMLLIICVLILIRAVNNLLKAGFFSMGSIAVIALAQRALDSDSSISKYLSNPVKLSTSAQVVDKLTLFILIWLGILLVPAPTLSLWAGFFLYLLLLDFLLPNILAALYAEWLLVKLFPIMRPIYAVFSVVTLPLAMLAAYQKQKDQDLDEEEDSEDIRAFIRAGTDEGIIEEKEHSMLVNLLSFNDTIVREIMTPRTDMVCADIETSKDEILDLFKRTKHSRLPIYKDDFDHIEGVLRFKDFVGLVSTDEKVQDQLLQPLFVPEGRHISDLMTEMLKNRLQMAVVIDEYGGTSGLITLEDLVEEIVGDIQEEHEEEAVSDFTAQDNGDYLVDGRVLLEDFAEFFKADIENEDVDTVGGFIFNREGRIPKQGSETKIGDIKVRIERADTRRIYQIRVLAIADLSTQTA